MNDVKSACFWWVNERKERGVNMRIQSIIPFLFDTISSLYLATRSFPKEWCSNQDLGITQAGENSVIFINPMSYTDYVTFRSALSFTSDIYFLAESLIKAGNLLELENPIKELHQSSNKFRDLRNFYTHLDERITNISDHGIDGEYTLNLGIQFPETSKDNLYLIFSSDRVYFSQYKKPHDVEIGKLAFNDIFLSARKMYEEVIKHSWPEGRYKSPEEIFLLD